MLNDFIHGKLKCDKAAQIIPNKTIIRKSKTEGYTHILL